MPLKFPRLRETPLPLKYHAASADVGKDAFRTNNFDPLFTMPSFQLAGLASGFDWRTFIDQIISTQRTPITRLQTEKNLNNTKLGTLGTMGTRIAELQTSVKSLSAEGVFSLRKASSTTANSAWSLSASAGSPVGSYAIAVTNLATTAARRGAGDIGRGINATNDVSALTIATLPTSSAVTAGNFTVNGAQISVATTDTLQDVFTRISTATGGAVTAAYDSGTDKISLTPTVLSDTITLGAANDTSNFLSVMRLANSGAGALSSATPLGTASLTSTLANARLRNAITAVDGSGNGSFSINGATVNYNVNTDSLSTVLSRINGSAAGVTATFDSSNDRVILTNKTTGNIGLTVNETAGGLLGALGLTSGSTFVSGENAEFKVNGGATLSSTSNTLTSASHGISGLAVTVATESTETIAITSDTSSMRTKIEDFITKFNSVQTYIDEQTKITSANNRVSTSLLSNNREVQSWAQSLRSNAFSAVSGLSGTIKQLENLGIDFTAGTSQLAIKDSAKLDTALSNSLTDVESFFKTASTGFAARMDAYITNIVGSTGTGSTGYLATQKNTLTNGNTSIDTQIANLERQLASERSRMETSFIAMEQAQARITQMQQQLTQAFSGSSN